MSAQQMRYDPMNSKGRGLDLFKRSAATSTVLLGEPDDAFSLRIQPWRRGRATIRTAVCFDAAGRVVCSEACLRTAGAPLAANFPGSATAAGCRDSSQPAGCDGR